MPKQTSSPAPSIPVLLADDANWSTLAAALAAPARAFAEANGFQPKPGRLLMLPGSNGGIGSVLFGTGNDAGLRDVPFLTGKLATDLPAGRYRLEGTLASPDLAYLGFLLGGYRFTRYKTAEPRGVVLDPPAGARAADVEAIAAAVMAGRDLINTPANDLTTTDLAAAVHALAKKHGVVAKEIIGDDLLKANFPLIHAVGRASAFPPRIIDFRWGDLEAPKVTLVGKGVVFDTGGLNLKPDASMLLMKKDMGGAAAALTAANILMSLKARINLRVIIPIVENSVAGAAFRPGDIYPSRKGITVEIGNTDAEGRLILADALALADEDKPEYLFDFATLTGAARVALGPDLPPFFTEDDTLATDIARTGLTVSDPVWRLPLWKPYQAMLDSKSAEMNNVGSGGFAGSITAALFLRRFVTEARHHIHFDIYGWVPSAKPGRPEGGDPQAARLVAALLLEKMGQD
ncbi:MAG: leucyl aminopeptidase [Rhizobiales bacterium PAR1]|nr:MAG: leucyl aminopeptidase [Rhizobiales bacterium PAR1]